jgi:ferredoxin-NADP reductase
MIAGGIGITPIRSMIQQLVDTGQHRTVTLYYSAQTVDSFTYWQLFNQAVSNGVRPNYVITGQDVPENWTGKTGHLTSDIIKNDVSDYKHAVYYLSGPSAMVNSYVRMLRKAGIHRKQIKTDYFPGF